MSKISILENKNSFLKENEEINKVIQLESFLMELNILEFPFFIFDYYKGEYIGPGELPTHIKAISQKRKCSYDDAVSFYEKNKEIKVEEKTFRWKDNKGETQEFRMRSSTRLPRRTEQDVYFGILRLFINKNGPFPFNPNTNEYEININSVTFNLYEICKVININPCGASYARIKTALEVLDTVIYNSTVIKDKHNDTLINFDESLKLINSCRKVELISKGSRELKSGVYEVVLPEIIVNNLKKEYFKFLNYDNLLEFNSGIERRLYGYLEKNSYEYNAKTNKFVRVKYVKRKYSTLEFKIPIDGVLSVMKRKLQRALDNMVSVGYLKGYILDKDVIYFCYGITPEELMGFIKENNNDCNDETIKEIDIDINLDDLKGELIARGLNESDSLEIMDLMDRYSIIKYILYCDKCFKNYDLSQQGRLLNMAMRASMEIDSIEHKDVLDKVESIKKSEENKTKDVSNEDSKSIEEEKYLKFQNDFISKIEKENAAECKILKEEVKIFLTFELKNEEMNIKKKVEALEFDEKSMEEINKRLALIEEFTKNKNKSQLFLDRYRSLLLKRFSFPTLEEYISDKSLPHKKIKSESTKELLPKKAQAPKEKSKKSSKEQNDGFQESFIDMTPPMEDILIRINTYLKEQLSELSYNTWIKSLEFVKIDSKTLYLKVPNAFSKDILMSRYNSLILEAAKKANKNLRKIEYVVE